MEPDGVEVDIKSLERTYDRYSSFYDLLFGMFFSPGRKTVVDKLNFGENSHMLEIGIGTGASISLYPRNVKLTGIDLSDEMLNICERRADRAGREIDLYAMNAEKLDFPDNYFTHVVAMYVVSVSPNPKAVLDEMYRVCAPGGELVILNHFSDENTLIGKVEKCLAPFSSRLGFKPFFPLQKFFKQCSSFVFHDCERVNLFGYWKILRGRKADNLTQDKE
jgi:phosphatidylethanolamine/phosphatidyl-N-methylethanolamine N-methyltransferase